MIGDAALYGKRALFTAAWRFRSRFR